MACEPTESAPHRPGADRRRRAGARSRAAGRQLRLPSVHRDRAQPRPVKPLTPACKCGGCDRRTCGCTGQASCRLPVSDRESPLATMLTGTRRAQLIGCLAAQGDQPGGSGGSCPRSCAQDPPTQSLQCGKHEDERSEKGNHDLRRTAEQGNADDREHLNRSVSWQRSLRCRSRDTIHLLIMPTSIQAGQQLQRRLATWGGRRTNMAFCRGPGSTPGRLTHE